MTDVFGPANATNSTTTRPYDGRQFTNADTWFKDCTNPAAQDGTDILAAWLNQMVATNRSISRANGLKADGVNPVVVQDNGDDLALRAIQALIQRGQISYGTNTGTPDAAIVALSPVPAELVPGMEILVLYGAANTTTTPVLNAGGTGNKNVARQGGGTPAAGDLTGFVPLIWDGAKWRVNGSVASDVLALMQTGVGVYAVDTGAVNALVATLAPAPTAYAAGLNLFVKVSNTNTGASTINVNGLGNKAIVGDASGTAVNAGDLLVNKVIQIVYDGTAFRLMTTPPVSFVGGGTFESGGNLGGTAVTNWTVPAGITKVRVRCYGGGGGGSAGAPSAAAGGGGGGYAEGIYSVTPGQVIVVTAGTPGNAGGAGTSNAGATGGTSSFGSYCSAVGGVGGLGAAVNGYQTSTPSGGGGINGVNLNIGGGPGTPGGQVGSIGLSGAGGSAYNGAGGSSTIGSGNNGATLGGGGSGGANGGAGGNGGVGLVVVEF